MFIFPFSLKGCYSIVKILYENLSWAETEINFSEVREKHDSGMWNVMFTESTSSKTVLTVDVTIYLKDAQETYLSILTVLILGQI